MSLGLNIHQLPPRSPADRRCDECGRYCDDGLYGAPYLELGGQPFAYELRLCSELWFCTPHGNANWAHYGWLQTPAAKRRMRWVRAEIRRRKKAMEIWDASLERVPAASPQLDLFRMAS